MISALKPPTFWRGLALGLSAGTTAAIILVILGWPGGEPAEGAMMMADLLGTPTAWLFNSAAWATKLDHWIPYIMLTVPLNGALLGGGIAAVAHAAGLKGRLWIAVLGLVWGASTYGAWWAGRAPR